MPFNVLLNSGESAFFTAFSMEAASGAQSMTEAALSLPFGAADIYRRLLNDGASVSALDEFPITTSAFFSALR